MIILPPDFRAIEENNVPTILRGSDAAALWVKNGLFVRECRAWCTASIGEEGKEWTFMWNNTITFNFSNPADELAFRIRFGL